MKDSNSSPNNGIIPFNIEAENRLISDSSKIINGKNQQIEKLLNEINILRAEKEQAHALINGILNSKSWKLTSFMRKIGALYRLLTPLFKNKKYIFLPEPVQSIVYTSNQEKKRDEFLINGPTPTLILNSQKLDKKNNFPKGWVRIDSNYDSKIQLQFFLLYYRTKSGYTHDERSWLKLSNHKNDFELINLPQNINEFKLEPFINDESFFISKISITEIGKIQLFYYIIKKYLLGSDSINCKSIALKAKKAFSIYRTGGITAIKSKLFRENIATNYTEWIKKYDTVSTRDKELIQKKINSFSRNPLISVLMPVYNTDPKYLSQAIDSVINQVYTNWELCIADDLSTSQDTLKTIKKYELLDKRIKIVYRTENGHISKASNSALELCTGEYTALLDHDDLMVPHALFCIANSIQKEDLALIFSDEDKVTSENLRFNHLFKTDWNPELILSQNFICHLSVYNTKILKELGGFRAGFEGAQDWDLALRVVDYAGKDKVLHIPHILYHWRAIESSTASSTLAKPYVLEAQKKSVEEHLKRNNESGEVKILHDISQLRVIFNTPKNNPLISLIIPTKDQVTVLDKCISSILSKTKYKNYEIIIVNNNSSETDTFEYFESLSKYKNIKIIEDNKSFNFSRINNDAVKYASGEYFAFLNNDLEIITHEWLNEMLSHASRKNVGAVGAKLMYPNGLVQHAGVILGIGGVAGHNHKGRLHSDVGYWNKLILTQTLSAVTAACIVMKKENFIEINGFDEINLSVGFNDVDLCLRLNESGKRIIFTPYAELFHHESVSRGYETTPEKFERFEKEIAYMKKRWCKILKNDPFYNPNLTVYTEDFSLAFPSRAVKPWMQ